jgi:hypothetical protein
MIDQIFLSERNKLSFAKLLQGTSENSPVFKLVYMLQITHFQIYLAEIYSQYTEKTTRKNEAPLLLQNLYRAYKKQFLNVLHIFIQICIKCWYILEEPHKIWLIINILSEQNELSFAQLLRSASENSPVHRALTFFRTDSIYPVCFAKLYRMMQILNYKLCNSLLTRSVSEGNLEKEKNKYN